MRSKDQSRNATKRANGIEPEPGLYAGVKRRARFLARVGCKVTVKNPERYLDSYARKRQVKK